MWSYLHPVKQRQALNYECNHLETLARDYTASVAHGFIVEYYLRFKE
jgi:hypothetical protein